MDPFVEIPNHPAEGEVGTISLGSLSVISGNSLTLWGACDTVPETKDKVALQIAPDHPIVIGRAESSKVPYLDPAYRSTTIMPGTGQTILNYDGNGSDNSVSRAHFMLRAAAGGIMLVNGVPRLGGGIRPPINGTWIVFPIVRLLTPGEEYLIEHGASVSLLLPNRTMLRIDAK